MDLREHPKPASKKTAREKKIILFMVLRFHGLTSIFSLALHTSLEETGFSKLQAFGIVRRSFSGGALIKAGYAQLFAFIGKALALFLQCFILFLFIVQKLVCISLYLFRLNSNGLTVYDGFRYIRM